MVWHPGRHIQLCAVAGSIVALLPAYVTTLQELERLEFDSSASPRPVPW